jgi:hypothetical protein
MATPAIILVPVPAAAESRAPRAAGRDEPEAIFIVGASRSGTTLLRTLLERSDRIAIAMENHYLGHLVPGHGARDEFRRLGDLADDGTIARIVDFIYSGGYQRRSRRREISPFWRWLISDVPRAELEQRLLGAERTERGIMAALLRLYADSRGKPLMGEKTPAHLLYVETLLAWFPRARVVHIVRDPRAVYVSDSRRRRGRPTPPYSWLMRIPLAFEAVMLVQTALAWSAAARRHFRLARKYPGLYTMLRFEDLVKEPEVVLPPLFEFLGVEMPPDATRVEVVSRGFRQGEQGLDAAAADRWRSHIHPFARRLLALLLRGPLRGLGYAG